MWTQTHSDWICLGRQYTDKEHSSVLNLRAFEQQTSIVVPD